MYINHADLKKICPRYNASNGICKALKYYDCAEHQCPYNAAAQNQQLKIALADYLDREICSDACKALRLSVGILKMVQQHAAAHVINNKHVL